MLLGSGERYDLLILDLEVPYIFEIQLCNQLQTFYPTLPILIYSFQPDNPQTINFCQNYRFLEKNEDPASLKEMVAALLQQKVNNT